MLLLKLFVCILMLIYASYSDWKTREVDDKLWIISSFIGITINLIDLSFQFEIKLLMLVIISISLISLISFIFYYIGFFGGADMKALIAIALIIPVYYPSKYIHPFTSLISLTNGAFLTLILPLIFFIMNMTRILRGKKIFSGFESEKIWKKFLVCFLGYRVSNVKKEQFFMSLQKNINGKKVFHISLLKDEEFISGQDVWVTPGIPLLIFITFGFLLTITFGDLLALFFQF
ncbi:MAG: A24 family peptidase C-terminal domain-containing protein [Nitrososphaerales archaeon]